MKIENVCSSKVSIKQVKRKFGNGRKFLQIIYVMTLTSRIYEELLQLNNKKKPILKTGKGSE